MVKLGFLAAAGLSLTIFTSRVAAAEPAPAPLPMAGYRLPEPKTPEVTKSYSTQILLPTLAFDIVSVVGIAETNPLLVLTGWGGRTIAGPIVHFAHGRIGQGFASLALEGLSPLLGAAVGLVISANTCDLEPDDYCLDYSVRGMAIGGPIFAVAGTIVDAALLANEPVKPGEGEETGFSWAPWVAPTVFPGPRKGELGSAWSFGVAGRF